MAFTQITVSGTYYQTDGVTPASGEVLFVASTTMQDSVTNAIVAPTRVTATLNGVGTFSVSLTATDDSTTEPTGVTYEVTERIVGSAENKYNIEVPENSPLGALNLADIAPVVAPVTGYSYATQSYVDSKVGASADSVGFTATAEILSTNVQDAIEEVRSKSKYTHTQESPATTWSITHNLRFRPNVTVVDTGDTVCIGDVDYTSDNALTVTFAQSFGGKAYLS